MLLQRLGLTGDVRRGLHLPDVSSSTADQDLLIDETDRCADALKSATDSSPSWRKCSHHGWLEKVRVVFDEAQLLFRNRRYEAARLWFQEATMRLAAYSKKTEPNTVLHFTCFTSTKVQIMTQTTPQGFPRWGEGRRLNKEWAQMVLDALLFSGECCLNLGLYADAALECTTALLLEPDNLQALYTRGLAYKHATKGDKTPSARHRLLQQAWKDLWKAHAVDPRHPLIIDALDECRENMRCQGTDGRVPEELESTMRWTRRKFPVEQTFASPMRKRDSRDAFLGAPAALPTVFSLEPAPTGGTGHALGGGGHALGGAGGCTNMPVIPDWPAETCADARVCADAPDTTTAEAALGLHLGVTAAEAAFVSIRQHTSGETQRSAEEEEDLTYASDPTSGPSGEAGGMSRSEGGTPTNEFSGDADIPQHDQLPDPAYTCALARKVLHRVKHKLACFTCCLLAADMLYLLLYLLLTCCFTCC
jgi:hypothetical protein